jgi:methionyl-tRNA formyltransferase
MSVIMRIVFMGSDPIALPMLESLLHDFKSACTFVGVFTQPDRPSGRGQKTEPNAIKVWAIKNKLPVFQPEKFTDDDRLILISLKPDMTLVMAYGHILRDPVIAVPALGTFNLHTSLLPLLRGASPIQTAVALGEKITGVSLMRIVRELDAGPVADQEKVEIAELDTATDVELKLSKACVPLVTRNLEKILNKSLHFKDQDKEVVTFCRRLTKEDQNLDFNYPSSLLAARINGLNPWPSASIEIHGQKIKVGLADSLESENLSQYGVGTITGSDALGLLIQCKTGLLRLRQLQRPGGRMLSAKDFLRGFPIETGTLLSSSTMKDLVSKTAFR